MDWDQGTPAAHPYPKLMAMQRFMLYAHRNTASDNREPCERKVQQKEGSKNAGFPQFIL